MAINSTVSAFENSEIVQDAKIIEQHEKRNHNIKVAVMAIATLGMTVLAVYGGVSSAQSLFYHSSNAMRQVALGFASGIASTAGSHLLINRLPKWIKGDKITATDIATLAGLAVYGAGGFITSAAIGAHGIHNIGIVLGSLFGPTVFGGNKLRKAIMKSSSNGKYENALKRQNAKNAREKKLIETQEQKTASARLDLVDDEESFEAFSASLDASQS